MSSPPAGLVAVAWQATGAAPVVTDAGMPPSTVGAAFGTIVSANAVGVMGSGPEFGGSWTVLVGAATVPVLPPRVRFSASPSLMARSRIAEAAAKPDAFAPRLKWLPVIEPVTEPLHVGSVHPPRL